MTSERFELPDQGLVLYDEAFLTGAEADAALEALRVEVPWRAHSIRIFGKVVPEPRLSAWVGDPEAVYTYSGAENVPAPWTPTLARLRDRVCAHVGVDFTAVLANLYRDGRDSMGMHADDEPELGLDPVIASLSLGAPRRFSLRHRRGASRGKLDLVLAHGSLLVMCGKTQSRYRHGVPKDPRVTAPRINLTFRRVVRRATQR